MLAGLTIPPTPHYVHLLKSTLSHHIQHEVSQAEHLSNLERRALRIHRRIIRGQKGTLLKIGGVEDHVHLLAKLSPNTCISDTLRNIKANSSKWINQRPSKIHRFEWQTGYAAFSVSESQIPLLTKYIGNQTKHHRTKTFEQEFLAILKKHNISYDPKYVFEREVIE